MSWFSLGVGETPWRSHISRMWVSTFSVWGLLKATLVASASNQAPP